MEGISWGDIRDSARPQYNQVILLLLYESRRIPLQWVFRRVCNEQSIELGDKRRKSEGLEGINLRVIRAHLVKWTTKNS